MMQTTTPKDYRSILKQELVKRTQFNGRYSLRAFARDLELAPSRLSEVFNGKQGLSRAAAEKICAKLGFSEDETDYFCDLVELKHARSPTKKKEAEQRIHQRQNKYSELEHDSFQVIADWYHLAILELMDFEDFDDRPEWIAEKLKLTVKEVEVALERLSRLSMIEKISGKWQPVKGQNYVSGGIPSDSIKKFHRQLIEKSIEALFLQPLDQREFFTTLIGINPEKMAEAKSLVQEFAQKFCQVMDTEGSKKDLYCFGVQFHKLSKEEAK